MCCLTSQAFDFLTNKIKLLVQIIWKVHYSSKLYPTLGHNGITLPFLMIPLDSHAIYINYVE